MSKIPTQSSASDRRAGASTTPRLELSPDGAPSAGPVLRPPMTAAAPAGALDAVDAMLENEGDKRTDEAPSSDSARSLRGILEEGRSAGAPVVLLPLQEAAVLHYAVETQGDTEDTDEALAEDLEDGPALLGMRSLARRLAAMAITVDVV